MKTIPIAIITASLWLFLISSTRASVHLDTPLEIKEPMSYKDKLIEAKSSYPFSRWRKSYKHGLKQYTKENCGKTQKVFDDLINGLLALGEDAPQEEKVKLFETAVLTLNDLDDKIEGLIETGEREELCALIDRITIAAGLNPKDFAGGEGIADEWREW